MKKLLVLSLLFLSTFSLWAERVDLNTARQVAQNASSAISSSYIKLRSTTLQLAYTAVPDKRKTQLKSSVGDADFYVFNIGNDKGFIIVSGENRCYPVLGYSTKGNFDISTIPDNMKTWLENYQKEITYAINNNLKTSSAIQSQWEKYLAGTLEKTNGGVLLNGVKELHII